MSLNRSERQKTRAELQHNLELSGWSAEQVAGALDVDERRVRAALKVSGADPSDVWLVGDALDAVVRATGGEPGPYTFICDANRRSAEVWFGIRPKAEVQAAVLRASAAPSDSAVGAVE